MQVLLKSGTLVIIPESDAERVAFEAWSTAAAGHVFTFDGGGRGGAMLDLGPREEACREPINIVFSNGDPSLQPISNLAQSPFTLRGKPYASIEGFWQGLKLASDDDRARVARLWGFEAKRAAHGVAACEHFTYDGAVYVTGSAAHHGLMLQACRAKFMQDSAARAALLATGGRPVMHRVPRDSKTIPGAVMADIWMRVRAALRGAQGHHAT